MQYELDFGSMVLADRPRGFKFVWPWVKMGYDDHVIVRGTASIRRHAAMAANGHARRDDPFFKLRSRAVLDRITLEPVSFIFPVDLSKERIPSPPDGFIRNDPVLVARIAGQLGDAARVASEIKRRGRPAAQDYRAFDMRLDQMEVGASFCVTGTDADKLRMRAYNHARRSGRSVTTMAEDGCIRIQRVS